ncbi:hypothetical protein HY970_03060 [Candidatus Kaiserbacteria bacterium]|nr:hypothetical protein [Candidatus Kaiserbacteria bacterium]
MSRSISRVGATIAVFWFFSLPLLSSAAGIPTIVPQQCNEVGGCKSICDIAQLAQNILNAGIYIAVILSAILFAWAGWNMLTAGGNSEQYTKGRKIFANVFIGLVIILVGWIVIDTLMRSFIPDSSGFGPWNKVCKN